MNSHTADETGLDNYERNHWFRGKMVTARDLDAEWAYHADRLNRLARLTVGEGIVCGLETTVTQTAPETLSVEISPGIGLDSTGRHVVVRRTATREVSIQRTQTRVSLYLTYRECGKESVPAFDGISACDDDRCEYNRILETFDVHATEDPPGDEYYRVRPLSFPPQDAFPEGFESLARLRTSANGDSDDDGTGTGDVDERSVSRTLARMARSYNSTDGDATSPLEHCRSTDGPLDRVDDGTQRLDQPAVFIGTFAEGETTWARDEDVPLRFVPTNYMLHDALVDHAAQFDNPHQVRLDGDVPPTGVNRGRLFAAHEADVEPVSLVSLDGDIDYRSAAGSKVIDLTVPDLASIKQRLTALEAQPDLPSLRRYVFDKTMKYKLESFRDAAEAFEGRLAGDLASDIAAHTLNGVDQRWYATPAEFSSYLFDETITAVLPERVTGSIDGGVLTLTEPDPDGTGGAQLSYEIDLSTQVFDAPTISDGRVTLTTSIFGLETMFVELVEGAVPEVALQRYRNALDEFRDVPRPGDEDMPTDPADAAPVVLELAVLQDQLCEAVDWLVEEDDPPAVDTRPVGNVFRGQRNVDLSNFRAAPDSGTGRLFDVSDPSDSGVSIPDVENATIGRDEFEPGSYGFADSRTTTSVVVVEPEISSLTLRARGTDATRTPIPAGSSSPVAVSATFNFSSVEGLSVTVTNDETGDDVADELTDRSVLERSTDTITLDVSAAAEGSYTVAVAGESMFDETTLTAVFSIVDASIDFAFTPASVAEKDVTVGTFTSSLDGPVFVMVPKQSYQNPEAFDRLDRRTLSTILNKLLFGDLVERVDLTDDYIVGTLRLRDGNAKFNFNTSGLRAPDRIAIGGVTHSISVSSDPEISFPPGRAEQRAILATAKLVVRSSRDVIDPRRPLRPLEPIVPGDLIIHDSVDGGVVVLPADGDDPVFFDPVDGGTDDLIVPFDPTDAFEPRVTFQPRSTTETVESGFDATVILDDIRGIGDARARKLAAAGVTDLSTLAATDSERLAAIADVTVEMAESWRDEARDRIGR